MMSENSFSVRHNRLLTKSLMLVGITLVVDGLTRIIFADFFKSFHFPVDPWESMVRAFIGASLLLNLVYGRFLSILYCIMGFLGALAFFPSPRMEYFSFKLIIIFYTFYYALCSWILIADQLKHRKAKKPPSLP